MEALKYIFWIPLLIIFTIACIPLIIIAIISEAIEDDKGDYYDSW